MRERFYYITVLLSLSPMTLCAEFRCESKVGYTVEYAPKSTKTPLVATPQAAGTTTPGPAESKEATIYLAVVDARAEDEAKAKAKLQKESGRHLEKVREECRERHENVGGCLAAKFETNASIMRSLSFSARKALEETLQNDCEAQKGRCKKVEATEPVCAEIVAPVTETPAAESGKDDKKKKK